MSKLLFINVKVFRADSSYRFLLPIFLQSIFVADVFIDFFLPIGVIDSVFRFFALIFLPIFLNRFFADF